MLNNTKIKKILIYNISEILVDYLGKSSIRPGVLILICEFIKSNNIDLVVHGFSNDADREKQKTYFEEIKANGLFKEIDYYSKTSTTELINKIKNTLNRRS